LEAKAGEIAEAALCIYFSAFTVFSLAVHGLDHRTGLFMGGSLGMCGGYVRLVGRRRGKCMLRLVGTSALILGFVIVIISLALLIKTMIGHSW